MSEPRETSNFDVPVGEWVDVPAGMLAVPNTYVDDSGVLRDIGDHSCVVWHLKGCDKRGIHASEIVYDPETNAPWCPGCWEKKKITLLFSDVLQRN
jgi:hypothetical protein